MLGWRNLRENVGEVVLAELGVLVGVRIGVHGHHLRPPTGDQSNARSVLLRYAVGDGGGEQSGCTAEVVQLAPDTQAALALVSAEGDAT